MPITYVNIAFIDFNDGRLALTYLTNLARPYNFELIFTEFGQQDAHLIDQILCKRVQGHEVVVHAKLL